MDEDHDVGKVKGTDRRARRMHLEKPPPPPRGADVNHANKAPEVLFFTVSTEGNSKIGSQCLIHLPCCGYNNPAFSHEHEGCKYPLLPLVLL